MERVIAFGGMGTNWCVHASTGCVYRIDLDIDPPVEFANSSVAHFASALHAALVWSGRASRSSTAWPSEVDRLKRELAELDPPCMQSDGNAWAWCLEHIREEGPHLGAFEKGSRSEGERALQAGPW